MQVFGGKNLARIPNFPCPSTADEDGLLAIGGKLDFHWLEVAYRSGIFPWPIVDDEYSALCWFSPDPRAILELNDFHISRRLRRRIRQKQFLITCNRSFQQVIEACAEPRDDDGGIWITPDLLQAYSDYAKSGRAVSIEVWEHARLVGGLYGVSVGHYFSAESMFHRVTDASKIAIAALVQVLRSQKNQLLDIQIMTEHMRSLGATEISREHFMVRLQKAINLDSNNSGDIDNRFPNRIRWPDTIQLQV